MEAEVPTGLSVPIGKGIIGDVAQTGKTALISDVYNDERFNIDIDKQTGYKTNNMLCMAVMNSDKEVMAAL